MNSAQSDHHVMNLKNQQVTGHQSPNRKMHGKSRSQVDALSSKSKKDQAEETKKSPILYIQYQDWLLPVPLQT